MSDIIGEKFPVISISIDFNRQAISKVLKTLPAGKQKSDLSMVLQQLSEEINRLKMILEALS